MELLAYVFAALAMFVQSHEIPADFHDAIARCENPVVMVGEFIGCSTLAHDGEHLYAGLIWIDGHATLETGP